MKLLNIPLSLLPLLALMACSSEDDRPTVPVPGPDPEPGFHLGNANWIMNLNEISFNDLKKSLEQSTIQNIAVASYSEANGLALVAQSFAAKYHPPINIKFFGTSDNQLLGNTEELQKSLEKADPKNSKDLLAYSKWLTQKLEMYPQMGGTYGGFVASCTPFNFTPGGEAGFNAVNTWGIVESDGFIQDFLSEPIDAESAFFSTTVISSPWGIDMTQDWMTFNREDGATFTLKGVCNRDDLKLGYAEAHGFTMVTVPLGNGFYNLSFVLPPESNPSELLTPEVWDALLETRTDRKVLARIPEFTSTCRNNLVDYFNDQIPGVWQQFRFWPLVNDWGDQDYHDYPVDAAMAVSVVSIDFMGCNTTQLTFNDNRTKGDPELTVTFDRPFYYVLHETARKDFPPTISSRLGLIFNIGWIADPSIP